LLLKRECAVKAFARLVSVAAQVRITCRQLTAKPLAVRSIDFGSAADNQRRGHQLADDITDPAA
jgi:hypothetical protein